MSVWLLADVLVLAVIAFFCSKSMKKGFLKSSYSGVASFAALVLVFSFHAPFEGYIEHSFIGDTVREKIRLSVESSISVDTGGAEASASEAKETVREMKLPNVISDWIENAIESQKQTLGAVKEDITEGVTGMIFPYVMQIISVILLYVLIRLLMWIVFMMLKMIFEIPILGNADKLLGAAVGGINALLIIYILSAALMLFTPLAYTQALENGINSTYLYKYFYYNNLITTIFL